jgi:hypothetical protein
MMQVLDLATRLSTLNTSEAELTTEQRLEEYLVRQGQMRMDKESAMYQRRFLGAVMTVRGRY